MCKDFRPENDPTGIHLITHITALSTMNYRSSAPMSSSGSRFSYDEKISVETVRYFDSINEKVER